MRDKVWMKLFDKSETPQRNFNQDKATTLFVIKSDKFDLFFNQILELREQEENSLNEKLKSLILLPKKIQNMVWNIIIYLEQPSKSRKYQNNIMES